MAELLGPERAETFMSALPSIDINQVATKADLAVLGGRMGAFEARMDGLETRMAALEAAMLNLGLRLDRMYVTLVAGLFVIVAAMVGVMISV
jgi:hypothetical protein